MVLLAPGNSFCYWICHILHTCNDCQRTRNGGLCNNFQIYCKTVEIVCKVRHFMHGNMLLSIIHSRLRNKCSDLKIDLFLNHLSDHDIYSHCKIPETSNHYVCQLNNFQQRMFTIIPRHSATASFNCNILLFGNSAFTYSENITIVNAVHNFIRNSKRFTP